MRNLLCLGLLAAFCVAAHAGQNGRRTEDTTAVFTDEGDSPIVYSTTCVSGSWSVITSSDSIRRSILMQAPPGNTAAVCISTHAPSNADTCADDTTGVVLSTGSTTGSAYTDYTKISWRCRSTSGTQRLKGVITRDSGDFGAITK